MASFGAEIGLALRQRPKTFNPGVLFASAEAGAWYDIAEPGTLFQDAAGTVPAAVGAPVGLVRDQSGRGNHAVQTVADRRPLLRQGGAGRPYLNFVGEDDHLLTTLAQPIAQPSTIVIGGRKTALGDHSFVDGSSEAARQMIGSRAGAWCIQAGGAALGSGVTEQIETIILAAVFDGANSFLRVNGAGGSPGDPGGNGLEGLSIGRSPGAVPCALTGRIYGLLLIGRRLSKPELSATESWFGQQYGVSL
jgi:hypothetical protein